MRTISVYVCDICGKEYRTATECTCCEESHEKKVARFRPGDILFSRDSRFPGRVMSPGKLAEGGYDIVYRCRRMGSNLQLLDKDLLPRSDEGVRLAFKRRELERVMQKVLKEAALIPDSKDRTKRVTLDYCTGELCLQVVYKTEPFYDSSRKTPQELPASLTGQDKE